MSEGGVRTFCFTDLVDSTTYFAGLGDEAADVARRAHFRLVADSAAAHDGEVVKTIGDSVMLAFLSPTEAVSCAVRIQQGAARARARRGGPHVRIGVNAGEATQEGGDWFGPPVVVASRLCGRAASDQILVSEVVRSLAGTRGGHQYKQIGLVELKGIAEPVSAAEVVWEPTAGWDGPLPGPLASADRLPCVGRQEEAETLRSAWEIASRGEARLALLAGEPGIGKTRVVARFATALHDDGAAVLFGRCDEDLLRPYQPFVEVIEQLVQTMDPADLEAIATEVDLVPLAKLTPSLASFASSSSTSAPETERYVMFDAVAKLLGTVARSTPLVVVLDDLHWADRPTLLLLRHILRAGANDPLLVLGTYRDTELDRRHPLAEALIDLRRESGYERVHLRGLNRTEVVELLAARAEHEITGPGLVLAAALHSRTEGNPLFVWESLRHLIERGALTQGADGRWVSEASSIEELGIPEGVREAIGRRLTTLSDAANAALSAASVIGPVSELSVLSRMVDLSEEELVGALDEATEAHLMEEAQRDAAPAYAFTHALVRHTLYEELSLARRQRLHRRAVDAIEAAHASDIETQSSALARHCQGAGAGIDPDKTVTYLVAAGQRAVGVMAWEEAAEHFEAAVEMMDETTFGPVPKAQLLQGLGDVIYVSGVGARRGLEFMARALELYESAGEQEKAAQVHSRLSRDLVSDVLHRDFGRARRHFEAAEAVMTQGPERVARGHWLVGGATLALVEADIGTGLRLAEDAVELAERLGKQALAANARMIRGVLRRMAGDLEAGLRDIEEAKVEAEELGAAWVAFMAARFLTISAWSSWDPARAAEIAMAEAASPRLSQAPMARWVMDGMSVQCLSQSGDVRGARALKRDMPRPHPDLPGWDELWLIDGEFHRLHQDPDELGASFAPSGWFADTWTTYQGNAADAADDADRLLEVTSKNSAAAVAAGAHGMDAIWWRPFLARARARHGDVQGARSDLELIVQVIGDDGYRGGRTGVLQARAEIAGAEGDLAAAEQYFQEAVESARLWKQGLLEPMVVRDWGRVLVNNGEAARGVERLDAAAARFEQIGVGQPWIDAVLALRPT
ncbi:MAG TPA: AAA family ATPase [Acidimicrobiales bacterium]|nr:AAA family ATPase [Acidimicrobiales bacterium]